MSYQLQIKEQNMKKKIKKSDIDEINILILNKIKSQLKEDLSPAQLNSIARLALVFQKEINFDVVDDGKPSEAFKDAMSLLDEIADFKVKKSKNEYK